MFRQLMSLLCIATSKKPIACLPHFGLVGVVGLSALLSGCTPEAQEDFNIADAQVRALLPGRDTTAGYFTLTNNKDVPVTLTGARSELTRSIEMHETFEVEGRVRMRPLDPILIPPGEQISFAPGGKHLMLFGTSEVPEQFPITLIFASGEEWQITFGKLNL